MLSSRDNEEKRKMNKSIFLTCAIITTLAVTMVLPSIGYFHAAKALRLLQGGINVGRGGVSVDVGGLHIHADQCSGVGIGSNVAQPFAQSRCAIMR